jgi:hypothetical protein
MIMGVADGVFKHRLLHKHTAEVDRQYNLQYCMD